jgi:short subunit dehydrogenase-like uncharacterized protein
MKNESFLLYGANGYTGELIARYAIQYGMHPLLAGRSEGPLSQLAARLNLSYKMVSVNDGSALKDLLSSFSLVVNAAGPFVHTAHPMIDACLKTGVHYIDINGDINVFEAIKAYDKAAKEKNIMLLPGAGFDVVPTDCMALHLKKQLPDAKKLKLAFASLGGGISHGTAMTVINKLGSGGAVRSDGKIEWRPLGHHGLKINYGEKRIFSMTIPWGDISTAYTSTGIPDIEVYTAIKPGVYYLMKMQGLFNWLLRSEKVRNIIRQKVSKRPPGPGDEQRNKAKSLVWGEVSNGIGHTVSSHYSCADGYTLTAHACCIIARKILEGNFKAGYQTPSSCFGEKLVCEIPGTEWNLLSSFSKTHIEI